MRGVFDLTDVEAAAALGRQFERAMRSAMGALSRAFARGYVSALDDTNPEQWRALYEEKLCRPVTVQPATSSFTSYTADTSSQAAR